MAGEDEAASYLLSQQESERIFREQIVGHPILAGGVPQQDPVLVLVTGQPGAGKTTIIADVLAHLSEHRGGAVELSGDPFKAFHPRWSELTAKDDLLAGAFTAADGRRWRGMAQDHLMRQRIDLVVETAGRNRADLDDLAARAVTNGYRVELVVLAAPAALSRASVLDRFEQMRRLYGAGRMVTPAMHDSSFLGIRDGLQRLDTGDFHADAVHLIRRGGLIAYSRNEPGAATPRRGRAAAALETERGCWTESEAQDFEAAMARLAESQQQAVTEQLPELRALAQNLRLKPKRKVQTARIAGTTFTGLPASRHQPAPPPSTPRPGPGRGR